MKEIYILKLISGVEIITNLEMPNENVSIFEQVITLSKPFKFAYVGNDHENIPLLGFNAYVYSDPMCPEVHLNGKTIESFIKSKDIAEALKKEYLEKSSGIVLA